MHPLSLLVVTAPNEEGPSTARLADNLVRESEVRLVVPYSTPHDSLVAEMALADLILLTANAAEARDDDFNAALHEARAPIFVAQSREPLGDRCAAVVWDGSLAASHAVRVATPLLNLASWVTVIDAPARSDARGSNADTDRLVNYLVTHGSDVRDKTSVTGSRIGAGLLSAAKRCDAGLLVCGAYHFDRIMGALAAGVGQELFAGRSSPHLLTAY